MSKFKKKELLEYFDGMCLFLANHHWTKRDKRAVAIRELVVQHFDKDTLPEKLKSFMAEKGLTIKDVCDITEKDPKTIWQFLHQKVKPHDRTTYKIKKLLMELRGDKK